MTCGYTAAGYEQHLAGQSHNGPVSYRVTMALQPDQTTTGDVFTFDGYPTPSLESGDVGEIVGMTVTIRTTGASDWVRGS